MNWCDLFAHPPVRAEEDISCFGSETDGDWFDETDIAEWRGGRLAANWKKSTLLENPATRCLIERIVQDEPYVIDLACGPGMGLLPEVNQLCMGFPCMATDANLSVLRAWRHVLARQSNVTFAQCSLLALPFREGTVQAYSSYIGLSSTRSGQKGYDAAAAEVYRTLTPGGRFYTVESEWTDVPSILRLFEKMGQEPWTIFRQGHQSWRERFLAAGFRIVHEQLAEERILRPEDNDLGEAAARFGIPVGLRQTAFILQK